jgi:hypothetical protein
MLNSDNNSTNLNNLDKQDLNNFKESQSKLKKQKTIKIVVAASIIFLLLISFIFLVPVGARTMGSRFFDGVSANRLDLATTNPVKHLLNPNFRDFARLYSTNFRNQKECESTWDILYTAGLEEKFSHGSFENTTNMGFVNPDYKDTFNFSSYLDGRLSLDSPNLGGNLKSNLTLDPSKFESILPFLLNSNSENPWLKSVMTVFLDSDAIANEKGVYLKLNSAGIKNSQEEYKLELPDWYFSKYDFNQENEQNDFRAEGIKEIATTVKNYTDLKLENILSEETVKESVAIYCQNNEFATSKFEVGKIEKIQLGNDLSNFTENLRVITTTQEIKDGDIQNTLKAEQTINQIALKIVEDPKLEEWLLDQNQYETIKKSAESAYKITENQDPETSNEFQSSMQEFTLENYQKEVKKFLEESKKEVTREIENLKNQGNQPPSGSIFSGFNTKLTNQIYLTEGGDYFGNKQTFTLIPTSKTIEQSGEFREIIKDGIQITSQTYNLNMNNKAQNLTVPNKYKGLEDLNEDVQNSELYKKWQTEMEKFSENQQSDNLESEPALENFQEI